MLLDEPTPGNSNRAASLVDLHEMETTLFSQGGYVMLRVVNAEKSLSICCIRAVRNHLDLETIEGLAMALNKFEAQTKPRIAKDISMSHMNLSRKFWRIRGSIS